MTIRPPLLRNCGTLLKTLVIFTACTAAQAASPTTRAVTPTLKTLYNFTPGSDGTNPNAGVVMASNGVLYGTAYGGGTSGFGTVFSLTPPTPPSTTWTETVLHSFTAGSDGAYPYAGLVIGSSGVLYGTTDGGGTYGFGTVFSLSPPTPPSTTWTEKVLYSFGSGNDGLLPFGGVVIGSSGVLYGSTYLGGTSGAGTVFSLTPPTSGGAWTESVLYSFTGGSDGAYPTASVVVGTGVLYGTTYLGGTSDYGTVFSLTAPISQGAPWTEAVLHSFTAGSDGAYPYSNVAIGSSGVLYGTTYSGGPYTGCKISTGCGTVFSLTPPTTKGAAWTEAVLHTFGSSNDGSTPFPGLLVGSTSGVLYGTTYGGGSGNGCGVKAGCGTVFALTPPSTKGAAWSEMILQNFTFNGTEGVAPQGGVVFTNGVLYGTTSGGGTSILGTVFSLTL